MSFANSDRVDAEGSLKSTASCWSSSVNSESLCVSRACCSSENQCVSIQQFELFMIQISNHLLLNLVRSQLSPAMLLEEGAAPLVASNCSNLHQHA